MADLVEDFTDQQNQAQRDQSTNELEEELLRVRAEAKKYQEQNARLRLLLESFIAGKDDSHSPTIATPQVLVADAGTVTEAEEDYEHLTTKYNKLDKAFRTVIAERDDFKRQRDRSRRQMEDYREHFHKAKKCIKEWQTYYDNQKHRATAKARNESPHLPERWTTPSSIIPKDPTLIADQVSLQPSMSPQLPLPPTTASEDTSKTFQSLPGASLPSVSSRRAMHRADSQTAPQSAPTLTSSQATADEGASIDSIPTPPTTLDALKQDSDPIEFVSERAVRRPARQSHQPMYLRSKTEGEGSTSKPYKLKEEPVSQVEFCDLPRFANNESLDLDEISGYVETPSKLRRTYQAYSHESSGLRDSSQDQSRASSMPADVQARSSPHEIHQHDERASRSFNNLGTPKNRDDVCKSASGSLRSHDSAVLRSINVNEQMRVHSKRSGKYRNDRHLQAGIEFLAEDGEDVAPTSNDSADKPFLTMSESKRRKLDTLLEQPTPRHAYSNKLTRQELRHTESLIPKANSKEAASKTTTSLSKTKPSTKSKRLRQSSPSNLTLEDFRINPNAVSTDEHGYAYTETVRGREARRCLPGCTDPRCCGSAFSKMVSIGGLAPQVPRSMWDPLSQDEPAHEHDQRIEERRLLDWHIGRDAAAQKRIAALTPAERRAAVVDARAALLAERHGKHRQAFARRSSPPGFWRTDMPTTQESKEDREKQMEAVRQQVRERWEEAMRGGKGARWVFRDEL